MPTPWLQYGVTTGFVKFGGIKNPTAVLHTAAETALAKQQKWMQVLFSVFLFGASL